MSTLMPYPTETLCLVPCDTFLSVVPISFGICILSPAALTAAEEKALKFV